MKLLPGLLSGVVNDGFSLVQLPGGNTVAFAFGAAVSALMERRVTAARKILLEELRRGEKSLPDQQMEEGVAVVFRYMRAAQEGAARLNLRLLAQAIAGKSAAGHLVADEFLRDADLIASLSRNEVIVLAAFHHAWNSSQCQEVAINLRPAMALEIVDRQLVPTVIRDRDEISTILGALCRTGLVAAGSGWGSIVFSPTSFLDRLVEMAPLEVALKREGFDSSPGRR